MVIEGWDSKQNKQSGSSNKNPNIHNKNRKDFNESEIFYSIKE